jgi:GDP-L-fucose synthase
MERAGAGEVIVPRSATCDLTDQRACQELLATTRPELVIHLAAVVGGIGANRASPGRFFHDNLAMGLHLIEAARRTHVRKLICIGTVCAYPKHTPVPFRETALWDGYPEETNAPYGLAKKALLVQLQAYRQQYGFNGVYLLPANLYGPGDHFDLETSHVIPAMIRKCVEARQRGAATITLWGDGSPTREFLFVEDCAEAIRRAAECYDAAEPLNIGSGQEVSIAQLATAVATATRFHGTIVWDHSRPNGQPRRQLDITRAQQQLGFTAMTPFAEGLARTVAWYERQLHASC